MLSCSARLNKYKCLTWHYSVPCRNVSNSCYCWFLGGEGRQVRLELEDCDSEWAASLQAGIPGYPLEFCPWRVIRGGGGEERERIKRICINSSPYVLLSRNAAREARDCYWGKHRNWRTDCLPPGTHGLPHTDHCTDRSQASESKCQMLSYACFSPDIFLWRYMQTHTLPAHRNVQCIFL